MTRRAKQRSWGDLRAGNESGGARDGARTLAQVSLSQLLKNLSSEPTIQNKNDESEKKN
jgi:hypothetical protein